MIQNKHVEKNNRELFDDGLGNLEPEDFACVVLPDLDYEAQLIAIAHLLNAHQKAGAETKEEIKDIEKFAQNTKGVRNEYAVDQWLERLHSSTFQDAAHSMSAVGMLAPLFESIFHQAFYGIRENLFPEKQTLPTHQRWVQTESEKWDCHFYWGKNGRRDDLVLGIMQLSEATGLKYFLHDDLEIVLTVLFSYRNKMFHRGFVWPTEERKRFWNRIKKEKWPESWLEASTTNNDPWIIYLTNEFIWHCFERIRGTIAAIGEFVYDISIENQKTITPDE
jgi:hypothetical protein